MFVQEHTGGTYAFFLSCCVLSLNCDIFLFSLVGSCFQRASEKGRRVNIERLFFFLLQKVQEFKSANTNLVCHLRDAIRLSPRFVWWLRASVGFFMTEWDVCAHVGGSRPFFVCLVSVGTQLYSIISLFIYNVH